MDLSWIDRPASDAAGRIRFMRRRVFDDVSVRDRVPPGRDLCILCEGTGTRAGYAGMRACASCDGVGHIPPIEERREYHRLRRAHADAHRVLFAVVRERAGRCGSPLEDDLRRALRVLEQESIERFRRMHASVLAGRVDDVLAHLLAYLRETGTAKP